MVLFPVLEGWVEEVRKYIPIGTGVVRIHHYSQTTASALGGLAVTHTTVYVVVSVRENNETLCWIKNLAEFTELNLEAVGNSRTRAEVEDELEWYKAALVDVIERQTGRMARVGGVRLLPLDALEYCGDTELLDLPSRFTGNSYTA